MSSNNNISEAIRRFGVGDETERAVVVNYGDGSRSQEEVWKAISAVVDGRLESVDELDRAEIEWGRIDKVSGR